MKRILPAPVAEIGAAEAVARRRPSPAGRPWVMLNMIASVDGAATLDGVSGGLGGDADRELFMELRGIADVIVAASGTVRAERYGPARPSERVRRERLARGQGETPPIAVITGSLGLDWDTPFFSEAAVRPIVLTRADAPRERLATASRYADVIATGTGAVDLRGPGMTSGTPGKPLSSSV